MCVLLLMVYEFIRTNISVNCYYGEPFPYFVPIDFNDTSIHGISTVVEKKWSYNNTNEEKRNFRFRDIFDCHVVNKKYQLVKKPTTGLERILVIHLMKSTTPRSSRDAFVL
jgi:hypothetical protein